MVTNAEGELGVGMSLFAARGTLIFGRAGKAGFDQTKFKHYDVDLAFDCGCAQGLVGDFNGRGVHSCG